MAEEAYIKNLGLDDCIANIKELADTDFEGRYDFKQILGLMNEQATHTYNEVKEREEKKVNNTDAMRNEF